MDHSKYNKFLRISRVPLKAGRANFNEFPENGFTPYINFGRSGAATKRAGDTRPLDQKDFFLPMDGNKSSSRSCITGFGLIEIVIASAVISLALFAFLQAEILSVRLLRAEKERLEATLLAEEAMEAARAVRDESWSGNIAPLENGERYYPVIESGKWKFVSSSPGPVDGKYERYVILEEVLRDSQDRIAPSGSPDLNTRKITARILWGGDPERNVELVTYLTNFQP